MLIDLTLLLTIPIKCCLVTHDWMMEEERSLDRPWHSNVHADPRRADMGPQRKEMGGGQRLHENESSRVEIRMMRELFHELLDSHASQMRKHRMREPFCKSPVLFIYYYSDKSHPSI
jgi:hypothetical protein